MLPLPTIKAFDAWLAARSLQLDATLVGGSALALLGVIDRPTRDFDILDPELPVEVAAAAAEFAIHIAREGIELGADWLNNGPIQLAAILPAGWQHRLRQVFVGEAVTLTTLGRDDLLKTKLFALCDRGTDLLDCVALAPSAAELDAATRWVAGRDTHTGWSDHVHAALADLAQRLGHGL